MIHKRQLNGFTAPLLAILWVACGGGEDTTTGGLESGSTVEPARQEDPAPPSLYGRRLSRESVEVSVLDSSQVDTSRVSPPEPPVETVEEPFAQATDEVAPASSPATTEGSGEVSYEEAESVFRDGRFSDAAELFNAYTLTRPQNPWGHFMLGLCHWKAGDLSQAQAALETALTVDPRHAKSLRNLSRVLLEQDEAESALDMARTAVEVQPQSHEGYRLVARCHHELGQLDKAIASYRKAILLNSDDAWSMNNLGLIYLQQERFEDAVGPLARATEIETGVAAFHNNLGIALERTGRFQGAARAYQAALDTEDGYERARVSLARVESRRDDPEAGGLDLPALAQSFLAEVETWRDLVTAEAGGEPPNVVAPEITYTPDPDPAETDGAPEARAEEWGEGDDPLESRSSTRTTRTGTPTPR